MYVSVTTIGEFRSSDCRETLLVDVCFTFCRSMTSALTLSLELTSSNEGETFWSSARIVG